MIERMTYLVNERGSDEWRGEGVNRFAARCRLGMSLHCGGSTTNAGFAKAFQGYSGNAEKTNTELNAMR